MTTTSINNRTINANIVSSLNAVAANKTTAKKYDEKYQKEGEASFAGVFLFITPIVFTIFCVLTYAQYEAFNAYIAVMAVGAVVIRAIAARWVSSIAAEQNRSSSKWMALSLVLPATSMIIIGQTKKLATAAATAKQTGFMFNAQAVFQSHNAKQSLQMAS